jgi:two-component system sensor histidine kinase UhpB
MVRFALGVLHVRRWQWLFVRARILGALVAAGLLALRPNADVDLGLALASLAWGGTTAFAVQRRSSLMAMPAAWAVDLLVCLTLVVISGQWRSPCYLLAVTALIPPATALPLRATIAVGAGFTAVYFVLAMQLGIEWDVLASTARSESFATHLLIPLLVVVGLGHATRQLDQLDSERERTEALALEGERRRIAWELHDSAKQRIHAAQLVLSSLASAHPADAERLRFAQAELDGSTADLDASLTELRTTLGGLRLDEALSRRADELQHASGVEITVRGRAPSLPTFAAVHAYRVACEAINNAIRHAQATHIDVVLEDRARTLLVAVRDDGRGIDDALPSTGLESMESRAQQLGAKLRITGGDRDGTSVELELPRQPAGVG